MHPFHDHDGRTGGFWKPIPPTVSLDCDGQWFLLVCNGHMSDVEDVGVLKRSPSKAFKHSKMGEEHAFAKVFPAPVNNEEHIIDMGAVEEVGKRKRTGRKGWNENRGVLKNARQCADLEWRLNFAEVQLQHLDCVQNVKPDFPVSEGQEDGESGILTGCIIIKNARQHTDLEWQLNFAEIQLQHLDWVQNVHPDFPDFPFLKDKKTENQASLLMVNEKTIADSGSKIDAIKAEALAGGENGVWGSLLHMMALASVIRRPIFSLYPEVDFRYRPLMYKLLNPRLPRMDDEMEPVRLLWSREGSLDNRPNAWYTPNHIVPVIWIPDASSEVPQMVPGETNKSSGSKQGSILSFLKSSPANPKAPKASKGKAENSTEKRSAENAELNDGIGKQSQKK
ncbi:hypothetical protein OS493_035661 [Desmophyllum pertusum]|uniref:Uncharacterized protein n=1 Tax=Desmophyllum pertusum TaxID=174260 RepID=A0A9W9Z7K6_9CNID|nr:hypothetical protein OS493_035661 [Desmophyllum pertusum]